MKITSIQWTEDRTEHIARHRITPEELEEAVFNDHHGITFVLENSERHKDEKLYAYLGCTDDGRYIKFIFIYKGKGVVYPVTALDMNKKERSLYHGD